MKNEAITSRDVDFARWYTDILRAAKLIDYSSVKGCPVLEPNGYAIWEKIQEVLDKKFKEYGHVNVKLPLLIPENLLKKESELVEGFAPEVAWVTCGGEKQLEERLCVRPTSETLFCDYYRTHVKSYRDLPKLYNQWCNIVRWEKETRPFLRDREILWQEGHTIHSTSSEAEEETKRMVEVYKWFHHEILAVPSIVGKKTEKEKFAEAEVNGIPVRIEIGKRDLGNNNITFVRRDTREKIVESSDVNLVSYVKELLETIQKDMYNRAVERRDKLTFEAHNLSEMADILNTQPGFIHADWCGRKECELKVKEIKGCKSRCIADADLIDGKCVVCGDKAKHHVIWGIQY